MPKLGKLQKLSTDQLVALFIDVSLEMKRADDWLENAAYNRAYDKLDKVMAELQVRSGDERHALLPLLTHPDIQVRLNAAVATLTLSAAATEAMQGIASLGYCSQAFSAKRMLRAIEEGTWTPT